MMQLPVSTVTIVSVSTMLLCSRPTFFVYARLSNRVCRPHGSSGCMVREIQRESDTMTVMRDAFDRILIYSISDPMAHFRFMFLPPLCYIFPDTNYSSPSILEHRLVLLDTCPSRQSTLCGTNGSLTVIPVSHLCTSPSLPRSLRVRSLLVHPSSAHTYSTASALLYTSVTTSYLEQPSLSRL